MDKIRTVVSFGYLLIVPVLLVALLALAAEPAAAASGERAAKARQSGQAGNHVAQTQTAATPHVGMPPLDLTIPAKIETATFALG